MLSTTKTTISFKAKLLRPANSEEGECHA